MEYSEILIWIWNIAVKFEILPLICPVIDPLKYEFVTKLQSINYDFNEIPMKILATST